jgi:hypothetical protein
MSAKVFGRAKRSLLDVARLEKLGFFKHVKPDDLPRVVAHIRESNFAFASEVHRLYHADAEWLAENGVRDFLGAVAPFLRREGIQVEVTYRKVKTAARGGRPAGWCVATLNADGWFDEDGPGPVVESMRLSLRPSDSLCAVTEDTLEVSETYLLFLGEREFVVYDFAPGARWDGWRQAARSTLRLLNELLAAHGSPECAYALMDDNDLHIAFAAPEMAEVINMACKPGEGLHDASR